MAEVQTLTTKAATLDEAVVSDFKAKLRGALVRPDDGGYDEARGLWNGMIDKRPALIVRASGTADVIAAVNFAREHGLPLAVRGGGHNVAGTASVDGGLVIDLSAMKGVYVDPKTRTARAQGGATWADLDRETQVFALATAGGVVSTTGIAGLTLGGGLGWLRRKHGLSCDNLVSAEVVTAEGKVLTTSERENPELFWAIRGGGGNFGVVTSFEYRLHPVGPLVYFFAPMFPADTPQAAKALLRAWREFALTAPDEVTAEAVIWTVPEVPDFPEAARGRRVVALPALYAGPVEVGQQALEPLRALGTPLLDMSAVTPYAVVQTAFDALFPKGQLRYYWKSLYVNGLSEEVIDALIPRALERPSASSLVAVWQLGGAMSRPSAEATAFGKRDAPFLLSFDSTWADARDDALNIAWTRAFWNDMKRFSPGGVYLNFPGLGEEQDELVRAAYGDNYARLAEIKAKYDPNNLFHINQNIRPAGRI